MGTKIEKLGGGAGGGDTYTNAVPVPSDIGGIPAGTTFNVKTMSEMWDALLYAYLSPTFSAFSYDSITNPLEVGDSILADRTFTWATTNPTNINVGSISIRDVTTSTDIATGLNNTGSYISTYPAIIKTTASSHTFRITGVNTKSVNFVSNLTVLWQWLKYYGESTTTPLTETDIESLRVSGLSNTFAGTYDFLGGGYKYLCYPTILGTAASFKDTSNNLLVPMLDVYVVSITNSFGHSTNYNVHRTFNILGGSIQIAVS